MDRYTFLEKFFIYSAIFIFMTFILLPFVEMFYASLRPLDHLFRSPYQFYSDDLSFWAYSEMWNTVPMLGRYIFNSFFLASSVAILTYFLLFLLLIHMRDLIFLSKILLCIFYWQLTCSLGLFY